MPVNLVYSDVGSSITNALLYQLSYPGILVCQALSYLLHCAKTFTVAVFVPLFESVPYKIRHRRDSTEMTKHPLSYMSIGATYTITFPHRWKRSNFRSNVTMLGRRWGRKFQCKTDGLTVHVMRVQ